MKSSWPGWPNGLGCRDKLGNDGGQPTPPSATPWNLCRNCECDGRISSPGSRQRGRRRRLAGRRRCRRSDFGAIDMSRHQCAAAVLGCVLAGPAFAQQEYPATLAGHAVLPAQSFIDAPADAPADLKVSGKYTTGRRRRSGRHGDGKIGRATDRRVAAVSRPAPSGTLRHQGNVGRQLLDHHRQRLWLEGQLPRRDAVSQSLPHRLVGRRVDAPRDHLPP